ncbi:TetR/AcrR family transcriptional regulator [Plantactinospora sonchi]|uniref:Helix-turn-helix domain-containing protein n=1 Tax=Plantactinospora sonchi TaxID=1544735 RepID=A0ABU7RNT1_9ACTN
MTHTRTPGRTGPRHPGDVRARIQQVALDLFIEEGYDRTSLREIAERVGVTKAALYYHFPAKEDLAESLLDERIAALDALIGWAEQQPDPDRMRPEFLRRYTAGLHGPGRDARIARFLGRNPLVLDLLPAGRQLRDRIDRMFALLGGPDPSPTARLRRILALLCLHLDDLLPAEPARDEPARRDAALTLALETLQTRG